MNILYIAYSCSPYHGSEDQIGWNIPVESAKINRVFVITKEEQREYIEKYLRDCPLRNIEFFFVDIPEMYKRLFSGALYSGRLNIWNKRAVNVAQEICRKEGIQIIHQITPIEFRAIGDYGRIPGVKFVCGPIAGGQMIPRGLVRYIKPHAHIEIIRSIMNQWHRIRMKNSKKLQNVDYLLFANLETKEFLEGTCPVRLRTEVLTDVSIHRTELAENKTIQKKSNIFTFAVVGRLVYLKGHAFLLDALSKLSPGYEYRCRIVGAGAELVNLKRRCTKLGLQEYVFFEGELPYTHINSVYEVADVLVMPSFREATGSVLLEAMSKGLPVITINKFGGATILDEETGWLYNGDTQEAYIDNLKIALEFCLQNPNEVQRKGQNARRRAEMFTWDERMKQYQQIYIDLLVAER